MLPHQRKSPYKIECYTSTVSYCYCFFVFLHVCSLNKNSLSHKIHIYEWGKTSLLSPRKLGLIFLAYQTLRADALIATCLTLNSALVAADLDFVEGLDGRVLLIANKAYK